MRPRCELRNDVTMDGVERDGTRRSSAIAARSSPLGVVPLARVDRDRVLVEALRRREPTAAERLITTYAAPAYRLAVRITGSAPDAEDVVQEAFWSVVRKIDTFRGDSAFGSWLYRIVANGAYGKLRREHARRSNRSLDEIRSTFDEHDGHREVLYVEEELARLHASVFGRHRQSLGAPSASRDRLVGT